LRAALALKHIKDNDPETYETICTIVDKEKPLEEK
jgi:hypothetical protein